MALQKRTIKIIVIVVIVLLVIAALLGILLGLLLRPATVELEVWPRGDGVTKVIAFKASDANSYLPWVRRINETLNEYNKIRTGSDASKVYTCSYISGPAAKDKVCDVDVNRLYPCTAANNYNYAAGKPCVFLRLNKVPNWSPKYFNTTESLPSNMPSDLKQNLKEVQGQPKANEVWVSCEGVTPADTDNLGSVKYIQNPERGFPAYYFPYTKQEPYLSPVVAVMFEEPSKGTLINVVCKAWAKNIASEGSEPSALARFSLKVDS